VDFTFIARYDKESALWQAKIQDHPDFLATSNASIASLLLGLHHWTVYNDSCTAGPLYTTRLVLTGCGDYEFTCSDATCVDMAARCDGRKDCPDGVDEDDCHSFTTSKGYNKFLIPPPIQGENKLNVNFSMNLMEIVEINEILGYVRAKMDFKRSWLDSQLTYQNIKKGINNQISPIDMERIWRPWIVLENIDNADKIVTTDRKSRTSIIPNPSFDFKHGDNTYLHNTFLFEGSKNIIIYETEYSVEWLCEFHMGWFPFDSQSCTIEDTIDEEAISFVPIAVTYSGPRDLMQHFVRSVKICPGKKNNTVTVEMVFGRPLLSSIVTITLPTAMLALISQLVTTFSDQYLDMVIEVNLTVLLVLTTL
jgi:hypothetical protein